MNDFSRLGRPFFSTDAESLAAALLGVSLVRVLDDGTVLAGRIVETEAYLGVIDAASHAFGGRRTARNEAMYGPPGLAYVYFTYGMHYCMNVVCGTEGEPAAVLLRSLEPTHGHETMRAFRARPRGPAGRALREVDLCSGPARLCQAMAIDRGLNGVDLVREARVYLAREVRPGGDTPDSGRSVRIVRTPRVGVAYAGSWATRPLRMMIEGSPWVSRPPRSAIVNLA